MPVKLKLLINNRYISSTSFQMGDPLLESGERCCIFPGSCVTDV